VNDQRGSAAVAFAILALIVVLYIAASSAGMAVTGRDVLPRPGKPYHCPHATLLACGR
jgi:hypothetical protein